MCIVKVPMLRRVAVLSCIRKQWYCSLWLLVRYYYASSLEVRLCKSIVMTSMWQKWRQRRKQRMPRAFKILLITRLRIKWKLRRKKLLLWGKKCSCRECVEPMNFKMTANIHLLLILLTIGRKSWQI